MRDSTTGAAEPGAAGAEPGAAGAEPGAAGGEPGAAAALPPPPPPAPTTVPFRALFRYASAADRRAYAVACACAVLNGLTFPLFALVLGGVFTSLGGATSVGDAVGRLNTYALWFLLLGLATFALTLGEHALAAVASERQVRRLREAYVGALLRQDAVWYDTGKPGEVASRLGEDSIAIQAGIGERATEVLHYVTTFVAGLVVGFTQDAALAAVVTAFVPLIVAAGYVLRVTTLRMERRAQDAYAAAAGVASEALGSIRTVAAFGGEPREAARYNALLAVAEAAGAAKGARVGFAVGVFYAALFCAYAVAVWYGGQRILSSRQAHPECRAHPTLEVCL